MSEETLKPLDLNQAKSHSQISFESLAEVKTTPSFFQKITTFFFIQYRKLYLHTGYNNSSYCQINIDITTYIKYSIL